MHLVGHRCDCVRERDHTPQNEKPASPILRGRLEIALWTKISIADDKHKSIIYLNKLVGERVYEEVSLEEVAEVWDKQAGMIELQEEADDTTFNRRWVQEFIFVICMKYFI